MLCVVNVVCRRLAALGFTYVQACRLDLGSGNGVGDAGDEAEDEEGGLHCEVEGRARGVDKVVCSRPVC